MRGSLHLHFIRHSSIAIAGEGVELLKECFHPGQQWALLSIIGHFCPCFTVDKMKNFTVSINVFLGIIILKYEVLTLTSVVS
jgi:hypothetical protein